MSAFTICSCPKCGKLMMWVEGKGWFCNACAIVCSENAEHNSTLPPMFFPFEDENTDLIPGA